MKALLVMDMQEGCVGENAKPFFKYDGKSLIYNINSIIAEYNDALIIYIRNLMKRSIINKLAPVQIYDGSAEAELAKSLDVVSNYVFDKYEGDAFTNPELVSFLKQKGIDEVVLVGLDGGGCVSLTAFGALKNGYKVTIIEKGIGTMFHKKKDKYFNMLKKQGATFL